MLVLGGGMGFTSWASDIVIDCYIPNHAIDADYFTLAWTAAAGGSTYDETLTDTAVTVDSLTVTANFVSSVTDIGIFSEIVTHTSSFSSEFTDTLISSDSLLHFATVNDTLTDIGVLVDSVLDGFVFTETITDTGVLVDTQTTNITFTHDFADTAILVDSVTQTLDQFSTITDVLVGADSLLESLGITIDLTDTAILVDSLLDSFLFSENITDIGVLVDSVEPSLSIPISITDIGVLLDQTTHIQSMLNEISDAGIFSEQLTHIQSMVSSINDLAILVDSITHTETSSYTLTDTGTLTDDPTALLALGVTLQDVLAASEIVQTYMNMVSDVNDVAVGVDTVDHTRVMNTLISDTGILVDLIVHAMNVNDSITDTGVFADSIIGTLSIDGQFTDTLGSSDSTQTTMDFVNQVVDIGIFSDFVQTQNPIFLTETFAAVSSTSSHLSRTTVFGTTVNLNSTFQAALKILIDFSIISAIQSACYGTVRIGVTTDMGTLMPFNQQIAISFPFTDINTIRGLVSNHPWVQRLNGSSAFTFSRAGRASLFDYEFIEQKVHWYDTNEARVRNSGLLLENEGWNECLWNRDFSNPVWTATNLTVDPAGLGADDDITKGFVITATAANGTLTQTIPGLALGNWCGYFFIKRMNGTGVVQITLDGTTWKNVTADDGSLPEDWYTRCSVSKENITSATLGIRVTTLGDSVAIDFAQVESGLYHNSAIETTTARAFKAADSLSISTVGWPTAQGSIQFQLKTNFENDPDEAPAGPMPVIDSRTAGPVNGIYITADHGLVSMDLFNNDSTINITGAVVWSDDHHHTIKFTWGGGFIKLYVNGVLVESLEDTHNVGGHAAQAIIGPCDAFIKNLELYQS